MPSIYRPTWDNLTEALAAAEERVLVCAPYMTKSGVDRLFDALPAHVGLELVTRLSPSDWASRVSDPEAILDLLALWRDEGNPTSLRVVQPLHAKLYSADDSRVLVGSSNLSEGGFGHNVELVVELRGGSARDAVRALQTACAPYSRELSLEHLRNWIAQSRTTVFAARAATTAEEPEALSTVQADLDRMLGFGSSSSPASTATVADIGRFVAWLDAKPTLPGAEIILKRHRNIGHQNLTGHVKQCFFGSVRFFTEYPALLVTASNALEDLAPDDVYQMTDPELRTAWLSHLNAHALDYGESYNYPTLRGILPPSLGGTRQGGGGGSSTLKRVLPLVARCVREGHLDAS